MKLVDADTRNGWLRLDDDSLSQQCDLKRYKGGGPGGQRRNKVQTGVKLHHGPSGLDVKAGESRSAEVNRHRALRRLRERIASEIRCDVPDDVVVEIVRHRSAGGRLSLNRRNPVFPVVAASMLDALRVADGSYARAGRLVGLTTSQVVKFLRSEPWLARAARRYVR